jgi:hypothetical protein
MKTNYEDNFYNSPQIEIIRIEVENVIAASGGNLENPIEGEESEW